MSKKIKEVVRSRYGAIAESGLSSDIESIRTVAQAFGYSEKELESIPAEANMGLSCGNPVAAASLKPGEVVVDLGCGGGLDVFLASDRVGPRGKAIGIDMTPEMIALARKNALRRPKGAPENVEFHLATIDRLPLPDASVDCVISNCVINLAPDKPAVFREIARVLRPGGRLAVSDIALKKPLPREIANDALAYVGCIAGAIPIDEYRRGLLDAGFAAVDILDSGADLNAYSKAEGGSCCSAPAALSAATGRPESAEGCCGGPTPRSVATPAEHGPAHASRCCGGPAPEADAPFHDGMADLLRKHDINEYAASVKVFAVKPR